uniref:PLD-like domain-containing protein n=1 Tax=Candidatus Kentrum sp. UNK TaxID=2126344 RepID=A0A451AY02_9GAMM|nr:MAG: PLD-like domain-containing protein [Candidatus Kentron sp. UNK]VFK70777.1 MAG: PLD-like domain-containing protein [Candidatus Kentron sp. UNK]
MVSVISSPWTTTFEGFLQRCRNSTVICSPYIGYKPCRRLAKIFGESLRSDLTLFLLTNLSCENMLSRATDVRGLIYLCEAIPNTDIRFLPNLHAKIYVSDEQAIVTSANLTQGGFVRNLEYGLCISDPMIVDRIRTDAQAFHTIGTSVDLAQLRLFESIVDELSDLQQKDEKAAVKSALRLKFEEKLREADEEVFRIRATSMSAHAGFAQTILFVLSTKGPCDTKRIYREIQSIHPDLCDDSVKLVIHGKEWSQAKWKHRVRHAQQFLSRQRKIVRVDELWQLS